MLLFWVLSWELYGYYQNNAEWNLQWMDVGDEDGLITK